MTDLKLELTELLEGLSPQDGFNETPLPTVQCIKYSQTDNLANRRWRASVCIVAQGTKELVLGRQAYRNDQEAHTIVTPIDLPVTSRVWSASPQKPFFCLRIEFDPLAVSDIAAQMEKNVPNDEEGPLRAIFVRKASDAVLEAATRLARLFRIPADVPVLGPLAVREILYHLLKEEDGPAIRQFVRSGSKLHRVSQVIHSLRSGFQKEVDVEALAKAANMSRSAFFKDFKNLTSMSPIQYQKRLRLLEARRLMVEEGESAECSAFRVGYNSASQFSREYSRMFGNPPLRDSVQLGKGQRVGVKWGDS